MPRTLAEGYPPGRFGNTWDRILGTDLPESTSCGLHAMTTVGLALLAVVGSFLPISLLILCLCGAYRLLMLLLKKLWLLGLFVALFLGSLVFPPLGLVAIAVVIFIVGSRINYLWTHRSLVGLGLSLYTLAAAQTLLLPAVLLHALRYPGVSGAWVWVITLLVSAVLFLTVAALVNLTLRRYYKLGYNCRQIHDIATTVPFVLLLLVLAIVGFAFDLTVDTGVDVSPDVDAAPPDAPGGVGTVEAAPGSVPEPPGYVQVGSYVRSNPDGIVENNMSFEGVRPEGTPEPTGYHSVRGHVRTAPDGIAENNLSYTGPASRGSGSFDGSPQSFAGQPFRPEPGPTAEVPIAEPAAGSAAGGAAAAADNNSTAQTRACRVVRCRNCGQRNRVPLSEMRRPICGRCAAQL